MSLDELSFREQIIADLGAHSYDPYAFVLWAFPWGEPGELVDFTGPNQWQTEVLQHVRDNLLSLEEAIQVAVTSGHGVGKSALVAWLVWWGFSTFEGTRGVVTANTENQLKTKTWVEISKWHRLFIAKDLFKATATAIFSSDKETEREWRIDIVPWSERNMEAFAGLHNAGKRILILFDEASSIPSMIWETTEGALTDKNTEILWFVFGNPTKNDTRFRDCFPGGKFAHRWFHLKVDSRDVPFTNKVQIQKWIDDFGLASDFVRVRILGEFPLANGDSFIGLELVQDSLAREVSEIENPPNTPYVLGVDVARFGEDMSVLYPRKGYDARSKEVYAFSKLSTTALAAKIIQLDKITPFDMIFVDGGGVGAGVVDILMEKGLPVYEVRFGAKAAGFDYKAKYHNTRSEIWGMMRNWLREGVITNKVKNCDNLLEDELTGPSYYVNDADAIVLESKKSMRLRGRTSPDIADALACTFAFPVEDNSRSLGLVAYEEPGANTYDPYNTGQF
jgi:hypothetical protein